MNKFEIATKTEQNLILYKEAFAGGVNVLSLKKITKNDRIEL